MSASAITSLFQIAFIVLLYTNSMAYGEIFETTNQSGDRVHVHDELSDTSAEVAEFQLRSQKIRAQMAHLAIKMNTYSWFTPVPQVPTLRAFNPYNPNQLPRQTFN